MSWLLLVFPIGCGFIGVITNWLALLMLFRPIEPKTFLGFIKWQGIVAKNFPRFAKMIANVVENELIQMDDISNSVDIKKQLLDNKESIYESIAKFFNENQDKLPKQYQSIVNDDTLKMFQDKIFDHMLLEAPKAFSLFMEYGQEKIGIREFILQRTLKQDPSIFEKLIYAVAGREMKFIIYYGGVFGAALGFAQYAMFTSGAAGWLLPVVGCIVGIVTNYMALIMLWSPREPVYIGGFKLQGAIPGRSDELLESVQGTIAQDFLVIGELAALMIEQITEEVIANNIDYHLDTAIPRNMSDMQPVLEQALTEENKAKLKDYVTQEVLKNLPTMKSQVENYVDDEFDVLAIMRAKPQASANEFMLFIETVLTSEPAMIVAYGGLFGGLIGMIQWALL